MTRKILLLCGVLASLLYFVADVLGGVWSPGYSHLSQAVSELSAIGAPSRPIVIPLFIAHGLLVLAFGVAVRATGDRNRALRVTGALLITLALLDLSAYFWPMNQRGGERTLTDTMHIIGTAATVLVIVLAIGFSATAFGKRFRFYSIASILAMLIFGALTGIVSSGIAAGEPTPWLGLLERVNIYSYLLWQAVLATADYKSVA